MSSSAESGSGGPWRSSSSWAKESRPAARSESLSVDETYLLDCVRDGIERAIKRAMRLRCGWGRGCSQGGEAESVNGRQSDPSSVTFSLVKSSQVKPSQVKSSSVCGTHAHVIPETWNYLCASLSPRALTSRSTQWLNATSMTSTTGSGGQGGAHNMCSKAVKRGSRNVPTLRCESGDPGGSKDELYGNRTGPPVHRVHSDVWNPQKPYLSLSFARNRSYMYEHLPCSTRIA